MPDTPPSVGNNDIVQVRYLYTVADQRCMNLFYLRVDSTGATMNFPAFANLLNDYLTSTTGLFTILNTAQHVTCENYQNEIQIIAPTRYYTQTYAGLTQGQHTTGDAMPPNVAASFWRGPWKAGKGVQSHSHIGGLATDQISAGKISNQLKAQLNGAATAAVTPIALSGGMTLVWLALKRSTPLASNDLYLVGVNPYSRVQHRRTVGVGK